MCPQVEHMFCPFWVVMVVVPVMHVVWEKLAEMIVMLVVLVIYGVLKGLVEMNLMRLVWDCVVEIGKIHLQSQRSRPFRASNKFCQQNQHFCALNRSLANPRVPSCHNLPF